MSRITKHLLLLTMLMGMLGCSKADKGVFEVIKPRPFAMGGPQQDAPQDYLDGFNDGCETGMATMSTNWYKTFYRFKQDTARLHNQLYYQAWKDAYTYCRQYTFKWTLWHWDHRERW